MKLFKNRAYTWRELGIFKLALLLIGMAIGLYWYEELVPYLHAIASIGVILGLYIILISVKK